jgi:hypothetical protein
MPKVFTVTADVHKAIGNGYRVKVSLLDLGVYINGMVVFPPSEEHDDWSVMTPARPAGRGKYARIVEFNKKLPLWEEVYVACVDAVKADPEFNNEQVKDVVLEDIDDGPIDLSNIPF